jgi:hypothetical protein
VSEMTDRPCDNGLNGHAESLARGRGRGDDKVQGIFPRMGYDGTLPTSDNDLAAAMMLALVAGRQAGSLGKDGGLKGYAGRRIVLLGFLLWSCALVPRNISFELLGRAGILPFSFLVSGLRAGVFFLLDFPLCVIL